MAPRGNTWVTMNGPSHYNEAYLETIVTWHCITTLSGWAQRSFD